MLKQKLILVSYNDNENSIARLSLRAFERISLVFTSGILLPLLSVCAS